MNPIELENNYVPSAPGIEVHESSAFIKVLVGGYGSGKTRCAVEEVSALASEHPGIEIYVMRKTMPALRDSTMQEFNNLIPPELGHLNGKLDNFNFINGSVVKFRSLDNPTKLKSTNPAVIVLDEADEFTWEDFKILKDRCRQKRGPNSKEPPFPLHIILILNPVDEEHWIPTQFVKNAKSYQDVGLLVVRFSTRDNLAHLPPGYIGQVTAGMTAEEVNRYVEGHWGSISRGPAIYGDIFNADLHIKRWTISTDMILCRGWDFGFNRPACVFRLKDSYGRKNINFEMLGEKEYLEDFARRVIAQTERRYGKIKIFDYCDPRGFDKSDKGATSVEILNGVGVYPEGERGVRAYVGPGIKEVRRELSTLIMGEPELTIDPDCTIIRAAYGGKYVRDEDGEPKKDGYYDHLCDADRYIAHNDKSSHSVKDAMAAHKAKMLNKKTSSITGY